MLIVMRLMLLITHVQNSFYTMYMYIFVNRYIFLKKLSFLIKNKSKYTHDFEEPTYMYQLPPLHINWYRTFMYSYFQSNYLAYSSGVSVCNQNYQFFQFFVFDSKTEIAESLKTATWNPVFFGYILTTSPVFVWFWRYIFIIKSVPTVFFRQNLVFLRNGPMYWG